MSLKARIAKLWSGKMSQITTEIIVTSDDRTIARKRIGNSPDKIIKILVKF